MLGAKYPAKENNIEACSNGVLTCEYLYYIDFNKLSFYFATADVKGLVFTTFSSFTIIENDKRQGTPCGQGPDQDFKAYTQFAATEVKHRK